MDVVGVPGLGRAANAEIAGDLAQLAEQVLPLADAEVVEVLGAAQLAELVRRALPLLGAQVVPQGDDRQQIRAGDVEAPVRGVCLRPLVGRAFAGILDRECGCDDEHLADAAVPLRLEHHAAEPRVDGQAGEAPADRRQRARPPGLGGAQSCVTGGVDGGELLEQQVAVADGGAVGRFDEGEGGDVAEADRRHLQDDRGEVGAQDLRLGELRTCGEVVGAVEADADAGSETPAPTGALVRRRLRHRLDRQPLHLQPAAVAGDAGGAGVDDVAHAGHGQRRLGDVGAEHDAAAGMRLEDAVLLGRRQPGVQREHLDVWSVAAQGVGSVVDLALAGQEHEHVTGPLPLELGHGVDDRLDLVAAVVADRAVAHLDGVRAPGDLDHRGGDTVVGEVAGEAFGVDRRRRHDDGQIGAPREQLAEIAEDEVDVEAALVRLVDDQRVVAPQHPVALQLGEEDAVGHDADEGVLARTVVEADRVSDRLPDRGAELAGDALGDRARGDTARLRVTDQPGDAAPGFEAQLRQLRALAGTGFAGDDHDSVLRQRGEQLVVAGRDRQLGGIAERAGGDERVTDRLSTGGGGAAVHAAQSAALLPRHPAGGERCDQLEHLVDERRWVGVERVGIEQGGEVDRRARDARHGEHIEHLLGDDPVAGGRRMDAVEADQPALSPPVHIGTEEAGVEIVDRLRQLVRHPVVQPRRLRVRLEATVGERVEQPAQVEHEPVAAIAPRRGDGVGDRARCTGRSPNRSPSPAGG